MTLNPRKVVITGIGALTPLGAGAKSVFDKLLAGESGIRPIQRWDTELYPTKIAAEVRGVHYIPEDHYSKQEIRRMDPFTQIGLIAAKEAFRD